MEKKLNFDQLNKLDPVMMVEDETIKENFIKTFSKIHGKSPADSEMVYERETMYWKKTISADKKLKECTRISLYGAFLEIAITGLSIQPGSKSEAYLEPRGSNAGTRENPNYIQTCFLRITAYGELNLRMMSGQIIRAYNPVIIYEGDIFQPSTTSSGELTVQYQAVIPRKSNKIVGAWIRLKLPDGSSDFKWLLESDIERLKKYSIPKYGENKNANALYTSENGGIDPGFLEAKMIKQSFRSYTKLRLGENVALDEDPLDEEKKEPFGNTPQPAAAEAKPVVFNSEEPF